MSWGIIAFIFIVLILTCIVSYRDGYRSGAHDALKRMQDRYDKKIADYLTEMENKCDE
jgi:hypothetical protein